MISFVLFNSPKPRSQVRILIYRKWSILTEVVKDRPNAARSVPTTKVKILL